MKKNDQHIQPIDLTTLLKNHENKWVVLSDDNTKVLYSADTLEEIGAHSKKGAIMKVPRFDVAFSPLTII